MDILEHVCHHGIEAFLFFDKLNAHRIDRKPLTEADRIFMKLNKQELIATIKKLRDGKRVDGEDFYGPVLMAEAAARAKKRRNML